MEVVFRNVAKAQNFISSIDTLVLCKDDWSARIITNPWTRERGPSLGDRAVLCPGHQYGGDPFFTKTKRKYMLGTES